ncbi:Small integral membrane protein 11 [Oryzias melastigma]|uniref:Small integral membrane protein 11 n=1 Tax=Oryzias melastigma TaxID=30732 RepID=A0A834FMU1_ORYME|nr:Small integral membrane protein 11 [Oryzias melastigma]
MENTSMNVKKQVQVKPRLLVSARGGCVVFTDRGKNTAEKMINWKALDSVPLLFYILALKTLLLCLAFAGVKIYQSRRGGGGAEEAAGGAEAAGAADAGAAGRPEGGLTLLQELRGPPQGQCCVQGQRSP